MPSEDTQFKGRGVGLTHQTQPICTKFPAEYDAILRQLPNRAEKIRQWVIEGMEREDIAPKKLSENTNML